MSYSASTLVYTDADFRALFAPFFNDTTAYPEAQLQIYFNLASEYISPVNSLCNRLNSSSLQSALYMMTAHLQVLMSNIIAENGAASNTVTEATVDKVRISIQAPIATTAYQQWLSQTPFGQMLRSLLQVVGVGGIYAAGRPELGAFRRAYGQFR